VLLNKLRARTTCCLPLGDAGGVELKGTDVTRADYDRVARGEPMPKLGNEHDDERAVDRVTFEFVPFSLKRHDSIRRVSKCIGI
jgi:hypothetical protein